MVKPRTDLLSPKHLRQRVKLVDEYIAKKAVDVASGKEDGHSDPWIAQTYFEDRTRIVWTKYGAGEDVAILADEVTSLAEFVLERELKMALRGSERHGFVYLLGLSGSQGLCSQMAHAILDELGHMPLLADIALGYERPEPIPEYDNTERFNRMVRALEITAAAERGQREATEELEGYVADWWDLSKERETWWRPEPKANAGWVGYWSFEAAVIAARLAIDDSPLEGHPHYPFDFAQHARARFSAA